VIDKNAVV